MKRVRFPDEVSRSSSIFTDWNEMVIFGLQLKLNISPNRHEMTIWGILSVVDSVEFKVYRSRSAKYGKVTTNFRPLGALANS